MILRIRQMLRKEFLQMFRDVRMRMVVLVMPLVPLAVLLMTPILRPFRLGRIFFTYLVPLVPALVFWDGVVSCLRTRTVREIRSLVDRVGVEGYQFEVGQDRVHGLPVRVTWLVGFPAPRRTPPGPPAPPSRPGSGRRLRIRG